MTRDERDERADGAGGRARGREGGTAEWRAPIPSGLDRVVHPCHLGEAARRTTHPSPPFKRSGSHVDADASRSPQPLPQGEGGGSVRTLRSERCDPFCEKLLLLPCEALLKQEPLANGAVCEGSRVHFSPRRREVRQPSAAAEEQREPGVGQPGRRGKIYIICLIFS